MGEQKVDVGLLLGEESHADPDEATHDRDELHEVGAMSRQAIALLLRHLF